MSLNSKSQRIVTVDTAGNEQPFTCEICGKQTSPVNTFSLMVSYPMPGPQDALPTAGNEGYTCSVVQHFTCSHEHALLSAIACMLSHIDSGKHSQPRNNTFQDSTLNTIESLVKKYY